MNDLPESGTRSTKELLTRPFPEGGVGLDTFHWVGKGPLALDLLVQASAISTFLFGTPDKVRSVYHIVETTNSLPTFPFGGKIAASKSAIRATFWSKQKRAWTDENQETLVRLHILLTQILVLSASPDHALSRHELRNDIELLAIIAEARKTIAMLLE
jgi:hypothetical protein